MAGVLPLGPPISPGREKVLSSTRCSSVVPFNCNLHDTPGVDNSKKRKQRPRERRDRLINDKASIRFWATPEATGSQLQPSAQV